MEEKKYNKFFCVSIEVLNKEKKYSYSIYKKTSKRFYSLLLKKYAQNHITKVLDAKFTFEKYKRIKEHYHLYKKSLKILFVVMVF